MPELGSVGLDVHLATPGSPCTCSALVAKKRLSGETLRRYSCISLTLQASVWPELPERTHGQSVSALGRVGG